MANYNIRYQVLVYQPGGRGRGINSPAKLEKQLTKYGKQGYRVVSTETVYSEDWADSGETMLVIMERTW